MRILSECISKNFLVKNYNNWRFLQILWFPQKMRIESLKAQLKVIKSPKNNRN